MRLLTCGFGFVVLTVLTGGLVALSLVATPLPALDKPRDVFGFADLATGVQGPSLPELQRYTARDGAELAFRFYDSSSSRLLIFIHGSSYHGGGYHALAAALSERGVAKVFLPNLRGHYMSGRRRGDVDYIGQLEDDVADLIEFARESGHAGPVILGGHSSGGGFAVRFAGGAHGPLVSGYLLLSPVLPLAPTVRNGTAGGWAVLHQRRLYGLLALSALGIHAFDGLPIIHFNKPEVHWDGTETLTYSYRLNSSYHPRFDYRADLAAMRGAVLVVVGEDDEANDAHAYVALLAEAAPDAEVTILPRIDHFEVFSNEAALQVMEHWLKGLREQGRDPR